MIKSLRQYRLIHPFTSRKKKVALVLLFIWLFNLVSPSVTFALTSGPAQPETQVFQPAGLTDMVDLSSGDFKYNIPLMDVDGYPLNLNYQSGAGIDDEATWVGLGWNMNVGAINRQLRGVPDDALGDEIHTQHYTRPKITIGGKLSAKIEIKGKGKQKTPASPPIQDAKNELGASGTVSIGIFTDNYTGIGAEVSANSGISLSRLNDGPLTAGLGLGVTSSTASGASMDATPSLNMSIEEDNKEKLLLRSNLSFGTNSRSGTKDLTLGTSYGTKNLTKKGWEAAASSSTSVISYNTEPISPSISVPYKSSYGSLSFDVGPAEVVLFAGAGGTGYVNVRKIKSKDQNQINKAYGFLYADRGKSEKDAVMDFVREKDNPIIPEIPNLAMPVQLHDLFSYTSQSGSGQFRLHRGSAAFGDPETEEKSNVSTGGADFGGGLTGTHAGYSLFRQDSKTTNRRWASGNNFLMAADFQSTSDLESPGKDAAYFKVVGEKGLEDFYLNKNLKNNSPLQVNINKETRQSSADFLNQNGGVGSFEKGTKQIKNTVVSYLTATEASKIGWDKKINFYTINAESLSENRSSHPQPSESLNRVSDERKGHHISEITVMENDGKRMIYGQPVYNLKQEEYSFAIGTENASSGYTIKSGSKNLVEFEGSETEPTHDKGIDHYYHKESQPAYATSYLLTRILSPDYVDKGDPGLTNDDLGTAIQFNYSKIKNYKWRTPYENLTATVNRGLMADSDDDKASIIYGEKEVCYIHSIETKTKIAYFITADRLDGLGVKDWRGGKDPAAKQKCLKEIRLYSKADMAHPIKVVKFAYNYELCPNTLNSDGENKGKLTLKKVWFEYGSTDKGKYNPYKFFYSNNTSANGPSLGYSNLATDRWGTYKPDTENPHLSAILQNDLFPYSNQEPITANANAAVWQLAQIELPTGGKIGVTYESDDYAFVQNKRAMVITHFDSLIDENKVSIDRNDSEALIKARGMRIKLDQSPSETEDLSSAEKRTAWFKKVYLNGSDYLYTKLYVRMSTRHISHDYAKPKGQEYDFVPCYAKIISVDPIEEVQNEQSAATSSVNTKEYYAKVVFESVSEGGVTNNPIIFAAWQKQKNDYPRFANPGFDNRASDNESVIDGIGRAVKAIVSAVSTLGELKQNFYEKANRKKFAGQYDANRSFIRLVKTSGKKLGGGARVQKIQISDEWQNMSDPSLPGTSADTKYNYGQYYNYTTKYDGELISSGVAAYEPSVGSDENPLKLPVPYAQKIKGGVDNYFSMEEPFGESLFPAPSIVYSKVTITDLNAEGNPDPLLRTGYIENEFYTAKDFPVRVERTHIEREHYRLPPAYSFISSSSIDELALTQGYSIELNDMHGKPRATRVYNQSKSEISSTEYFYNTEPTAPGEIRLKNTVKIVDKDSGLSSDQVIGRDVDFYTDMREQESSNIGYSVQLGLDVVRIGIFPIPIPHWPGPPNSEYKLFRSVVAVKVAQYYGIISKVVKKENGSSISTENIAYDGLTGEPLVTKTQNEFNQDIYSVNLPAYWVYKGMGAAYQNMGMIFQDLTTNLDGKVIGSYSTYLHPGDELVDLNPESPEHFWVIETAGTKKLINKDGAIYSGTLGLAKIIRSGYRNMLQPSTSNLVSLKNPLENNFFTIKSPATLDVLKVINASTSLFDEKWAPQSPKIEQTTNYVTIPIKIVHVWGHLSRINHSPRDGYKNNSTDASQAFHYTLVNSTATFYKGESSTTQPDLIPSNQIKYTDTIYLKDYTQKINNGNIDNEVWNYSVAANSENYTEYGSNIFKNSAKVEGGFTLPFFIPTDRSLIHYHDAQSIIDYVKTVFESNDSETAYVGDFPLYDQVESTTVNNPINPYVQGYLGNWRLSESKVYQEDRNNNEIFKRTGTGINLKDAGYFSGFNPYWQHTENGWSVNPTASKWITANTVTLYDVYGQELENKDALRRYSAAKFDFNGELPSAVASNAMNREIYANSFEDYKFRDVAQSAFGAREFSGAGATLTIAGLATDAESHTGNYSAQIPMYGVRISTMIHNQEHKLNPNPYLGFSTKNEYTFLSTPGLYPRGFEPQKGLNKKYILNAWIKDSHPTDRNLDLSLTLNNGLPIKLTCKAIVEGWKLVEVVIDMGTISGNDLILALVPTVSGLYIDDIRIHPFDAHMKTYAYNDKSFKLMAELDENAFATLYEYDDEGSLIRVKKETERGIMTIKESRSAYRKR